MCFTYWGGGAFADVTVNAENFPDDAFREYVYDFDKNEDDILSTAELATVTEIDVRECEISSLKGIEYFTSLEYLDCSKNMITELDVSKNTALQRLTCDENRSYEYDSENYRYNYTCYLASLNVTGCTALQYLSCWGNALTTLDLSTNTALTYLDCSGNKLMTLDVSRNTALTDLECGDNKLAALDVSGHIYL